MSESDGTPYSLPADSGNAYSTLPEDWDAPQPGDDAPAPAAAEPAPAAVVAPGRFPDGSRMWIFVPEADPRSWSDFDYIDTHLEEVRSLGWITDNVPGYFWTLEDAIEAYELWAKAATEAYRTTEDEDGVQAVVPYVPVADRPPPEPSEYADPYAIDPGAPGYLESAAAAVAAQGENPPPAAAAPAGPQWQRPEDRVDPMNPQFGGTNYDDVMGQLRQTVPENDGRWTASRAAQFDGDQQFLDAQGITAAQDALTRAGEGLAGADGVVDAAAYDRTLAADAEVGRAYAQADGTRNHYQQSTDFRPQVPPDEQQRQIDESLRQAREQAEADPAAYGLGMTTEQRESYADAQDYAARTGQQIDLQRPLNDEQRAWLAQVRQAEQAQAEQDAAAWQASEEGQRQQAAYDRRAEFARTEQERAEASRRAAEERMGGNG